MLNLLNNLMTVEEIIPSQTGGDVRYSYVTKHEDVRCRIQQAAYKDIVRSGRQESGIAYVVYCQIIDITQKDFLVIDSVRYNIFSITKEGNASLYLKILCEVA